MQDRHQTSQTRIARDSNGERSSYDEIVVGQDLGTLDWEVREEDIVKQRMIDDDEAPMFVDGGESYESMIAPPQLNYRPPRWLFSRTYNVRGVLYRWGFESFAPLRPGTTVKVAGYVSDKWIKNDREFVEYTATGTNQNGELLFRSSRVHALDVITRSAPRDGVGVDSGKKAEKI